jgi:GST-like protein
MRRRQADKEPLMTESDYVPPEVWSWDPEGGGGSFGKLNRPVSGATFERELPRGVHPYQLHSIGSPNGQKVTIMFEELLDAGFAEAEYDAWMINIMEGDQFGSGFVALNPNSKIPALLDLSGPKPVRVFESAAILLHLAERFGVFLPADTAVRAECFSWLMWQMSTAPVLGGGFGHFYSGAPVKIEYAINRYAMEAKRIVDVADKRLADVRYLAGDEYTIADISAFAWLNYFQRGDAYRGSRFLDMASYRHVARWIDEISARRGVQRGLKVNRPGEGQVLERHSAADIDAVMGG